MTFWALMGGLLWGFLPGGMSPWRAVLLWWRQFRLTSKQLKEAEEEVRRRLEAKGYLPRKNG